MSGRPQPGSRWSPGPGFPPHSPLRPAPREEMHWNVRGGGGRRGPRRRTRGGPSLGSPAPGSGTEYVPSSRPGESSGPQPFPSALSQMVKRGGVPAGKGRGVCVCVAGRASSPRGRGLGSDVERGRGADGRAPARLGNGWWPEGLGGAGCGEGVGCLRNVSSCLAESVLRFGTCFSTLSPPFSQDEETLSYEDPR